MPESDTIIIVYAHPNGTLDDWEVTIPTGWAYTNGAARR